MKRPTRSLDFFFSPRSIAVIGASRDKDKVGHLILRNVLCHGYEGTVYAVNPKARSIFGCRSYSSVVKIPEPPDLAIIAIPAPFVQQAVSECAKKGIKGAIIITAGFRETGLYGAELEEQIKKTAREGNLRLLGPNCLGLIDTRSHLNASFARGMPIDGSMAFFSQSGALCQAILDWALGEGVGFSKFISIGNKADIDEVSLLEALAEDPDTRVILGYIEGVSDGERFIEAAARVTPKKPFIITKSGTTEAGARAVASHTGSLTGSDLAFQAACEAAGIVRARTVGELFNFALAFASQPILKGPRLAVVTNAGGPGIMAADAIESASVKLAGFSRRTIGILRRRLPAAAGIYNPVDIVGDARADRYRTALDAVMKDPGVDGALVLLTPQVMTEVEETARCVVEASRKAMKPVMTSFMGGQSIRKAQDILHQGSIPNYNYPEHAVSAFDAMYRYCRRRDRKRESLPSFRVRRKEVARAIIHYRRQGRLQLGEEQAHRIFEDYHFPMVETQTAGSAEEAASVARKIGFPVALKISSEEILHKSDIGGVKLGLADETEVRKAFGEVIISARKYFPEGDPRSVLVQPMVSGGREVIVGANRDPVFGPMILFGLGGVYVEILRDISLRMAPLSRGEARGMIGEIRSYPILTGLRGEPPADMEVIIDCLLKMSALITDHPAILEAEINPLMVFESGKGGLGIDSRIIIKEEKK